MHLFWVTSIAWPAYVGYQAYNIVEADSSWTSKGLNLGAAGLSTIVTRALLLYVSTHVAANFGNGLRDKVFGKRFSSIVSYGSMDATLYDFS
jgi:hypothetical protein